MQAIRFLVDSIQDILSHGAILNDFLDFQHVEHPKSRKMKTCSLIINPYTYNTMEERIDSGFRHYNLLSQNACNYVQDIYLLCQMGGTRNIYRRASFS